MAPQEKSALDDLCARIQSLAGQARDPEAETYLADFAKVHPHAIYVLAQNVLLQQQALQQAQVHMRQLEQQLQQQQQQRDVPAPASFLGAAGLSIVPQVPPAAPSQPASPAGSTGSWGQTQNHPQAMAAPYQQSQSFQQPAPSPWLGQPAGGGFLSGAMGTMAGVAGGVLLADAIGSLFHHQSQMPSSAFMAAPVQNNDALMDSLSASFDGSSASPASDDLSSDTGGSDFDSV
jgi:uncharacterized protein